MKGLLFTLVVGVVFLAACKKKEERPVVPSDNLASPQSPLTGQPNKPIVVQPTTRRPLTPPPVTIQRTPTTSLNGLPFRSLGSSTYISGETLNGTGKIVFTQPLSAPNSDNAFTLTMDLTRPGSSVTLIANAQDDLSQGVSIRIQNDNLRPRVILSAQDTQPLELSSLEAFAALRTLDLRTPIEIRFDIHNSHRHFILKDNRGETLANVGRAHTRGMVGRGIFWGLELQDAAVSQPSVSRSDH